VTALTACQLNVKQSLHIGWYVTLDVRRSRQVEAGSEASDDDIILALLSLLQLQILAKPAVGKDATTTVPVIGVASYGALGHVPPQLQTV